MAAYEAGVSSSSTESSAVVLLAEEASSAATVPRLLDVILARPTLLTPLCSTEHNVSTSTLQLSEEDIREQCSVTKQTPAKHQNFSISNSYFHSFVLLKIVVWFN